MEAVLDNVLDLRTPLIGPNQILLRALKNHDHIRDCALIAYTKHGDIVVDFNTDTDLSKRELAGMLHTAISIICSD